MVIVLGVAFTLAGVCEEQKVVEADKLMRREGLLYEINTEEPFTGIAVSYWPSGEVESESEWRDGKPHGKNIRWYENGQKRREIEFRDGEFHGKWTVWYENGQKKEETEFHDDKLIGRKEWDRDGNLIEEW